MDSHGKNIWPLILMVVGVIIVGGVFIWYFRSAGEPALATPTSPILGGGINPTNIPRVSLADAKAAFDSKTAVFVDTRDVDSYARSHITGALSIPVSDLLNNLGELNKSDWIITYCT